MRKILVFIFLVCTFLGWSSDGDIGIGQWRTHLPFASSNSVTRAGDLIFFATDGSLFSYDLTENTLAKYSKTEGLTSYGINTIEYYEKEDRVIIGYENGNIDLFSDQGTIAVPDIAVKNMTGSKKINDIYLYNDTAYLSTDFGIVVLNLAKKEIINTFLIGDEGTSVKVSKVKVFENKIYAQTANGLKTANLNGSNLADFNFWTTILINENPIDSNYVGLEVWNDQLITAVNDSIFGFKDSTWNYLFSGNSDSIHIVSFKSFGDQLAVIESLDSALSTGDIMQLKVVTNTFEETVYNVGTISTPKDVELVESDLYVADSYIGAFVMNSSGRTGIAPNGPSSYNVYDFYFDGWNMHVAPGGVTTGWDFKYITRPLFSFGNNRWWSLWSSSLSNVTDILQVINDPVSGNMYMASYGSGLIEMESGTVSKIYKDTIWSYENGSYVAGDKTTMVEVTGHDGNFRITGMAFDASNNLWFTSYASSKPLNCKLSDGTWVSFSGVDIPNDYVSDILIDNANQKWMICPRGSGIAVFNDGGTIEDKSDDQWMRLTTGSSSGNLPSVDVFALTKDKDGELWIGTDDGIAVLYCPEVIFSNGCNAQKITIEKDGYLGYAFEGQQINCIEVDGANRKWIGTETGVYLMSEDGTEEIHHFTAENSPLLSNSVLDIGIDDRTGEVFFGTEIGIISFKSDATVTPTSSELIVFPNPVEPDYSGTIAVRGLPDNSDVKITDIGGNVIYHSIAIGGQAIWDGNDFTGHRVPSGVYLVWATNDTGSNTAVTKIVFLN